MSARSSHPRLNVYVYPREKKIIDDAAAQAGLPTGTWLRLIALDTARKIISDSREPFKKSVDRQ